MGQVLSRCRQRHDFTRAELLLYYPNTKYYYVLLFDAFHFSILLSSLITFYP